MINDFSRTLSLLRIERKLSQKNAAEELGVSQALLSHYENGAREPGLAFVVKAADYYGVSADFLLGRSSSRKSAEAGIKSSKNAVVSASSELLELAEGDKSAETEIKRYLQAALYKMCGCLSDGEKAQNPCYSELCDVLMKKCEMRLKKLPNAKKELLSEGIQTKPALSSMLKSTSEEMLEELE